MTDLYLQRKALLEQMDQIQTMVPGTLSEQYITRKRDGKPVRFGPYYKLQLWCQGKNLTRYVTAEQVPDLRVAIANHQRFEDLCQQFVELTVAMDQEEESHIKKKSKPKSTMNGSEKPKRFSG